MAFDLQVFNQETYTTITEVMAQEVDKFNTASGGAIVLQNKPTRGDYDIVASFKEIANLVRFRDVYGSNTLTHERLQQLQNIAVKVGAGTSPIDWEPAQYAWTMQNPTAAAVVIGEQLAKARIAQMLNAVITSLVAAVSGNSAMVSGDGTGDTSFIALNSGAAKMGDRSMALKAWVMHSATIHKLYSNALTNAENLFSYESVNVIRDSFGRLFVVTDSPALIDTSGTDPILKTLGLISGAALVQNNNDFNSAIVPVVGKENIGATYQAEWSYNVGLNGYTWDAGAGGKSPNATALGTASNWDKTASDNKNTAGVLVLTK